MSRALGPLLLLVFAGQAAAAPRMTAQSDPHPGIHRETWTDDVVPATIHLVRIDLTSAEIGLYATRESDLGQTTSSYANLLNAQVAINGDSFSVDHRPFGFAMGESATWTQTGDDCSRGVLHFGRSGERTYAVIDPPEVVTTPETMPAFTQAAISGQPLLVRNGVAEKYACEDVGTDTVPCAPAPRTAVAVSADGNRMWLAVVDGWQTTSIGLTINDLATFLEQRGAHMAIAFDGGSSSTLVIDGSVVNKPSDGVERTGANHLAIKYGALPTNTLTGFICNTPDIAACGTDPALQINGATVTLDDLRVQTPSNPAQYLFPGVTQRFACVTVKKTGYQTKVQCKQVTAGGPAIYNSVYLERVTSPAPASAPAPIVPADPAACIDAGTDGGVQPEDPGVGCCDAGDLGTSRLLLVALVAFMLTRRRGTKA